MSTQERNPQNTNNPGENQRNQDPTRRQDANKPNDGKHHEEE